MKFLFDDESFSFGALRAAGYASGSGADLGEVLVTCANIPDGDEEAWCREWGALADRIHGVGLAALTAGHRISARDALLRASNYYRTAEFYRRSDPDNDAESARLARLSRESFAAAAGLLDVPACRVAISQVTEDGLVRGFLQELEILEREGYLTFTVKTVRRGRSG